MTTATRRSLLLALALLAPLGPARAAGEFRARGFLLPPGSVKVDEDRYRLPLAWDEAQRFFRNNYPLAKFPRRTLPNQNGVRAVHLGNPKPGEDWEGANIYEAGRGEVRVFVLATRPRGEKS